MREQDIPKKYEDEEKQKIYKHGFADGYVVASKEIASSAMGWLKKFGFRGLYGEDSRNS